jgi:hypothetical protein
MFLSVPAVNALMCGLLVPEAPEERRPLEIEIVPAGGISAADS